MRRYTANTRQTWIAYSEEYDVWKTVNAGNAEGAAEAAERATDEPDDASDGWSSTWIVAVAPDDFDEANPEFPDPDDFEGERRTVHVEREVSYHYSVSG